MNCPECNADNPAQAKFCLNCGHKLILLCPGCGTELPSQAKFCFECGAKIGIPDSPPPTPPPPPAPPPDPMEERLRRLVPAEFADRLRAARGKVQGERRIVTILFSDVKGSTAMAEEMDPEDVMEIMDGAFDVLIEPIYRHEGTLARLMGDAILAFFGAPIAHENDPERACRAALEIVEGAQAYAARLEQEQGISGFNVRVGINTGLVVVGEVGSDLRAEYTAMGDAINLAARMEQNAPVGGILISSNTYRQVRGLFDVQVLDPIAVKGKREPVEVYLVQRAKPRVFRLEPRGVVGVETRMIGRREELERLQGIFRQAIEGSERQMVTVSGEAGLGKSRLLYEFENWLELLPETICYFRGRASQETRHQPYALIRGLLASRFEIQDSDPIDAVRTKFERGIAGALDAGYSGELDSRAVMRAHLVGQLLGFDFAASPHLHDVLDDAQQLRDRGLVYLGEFFRVTAASTPTVIFLEDIHWADGSSLDAIDQLAKTIPDQRLLIICLARPSLFERRPQWAGGPTLSASDPSSAPELAYHTLLELQPLSEKDSRRLVEEILRKVENIPATLRQLVVDRAEGNPLYVEELIKMLAEDGVILKGDDPQSPWRIETERLAEIRVPATLVGVVQARLDSLSFVEQKILQRASVVGRTFWDSAIGRIGGSTGEGIEESEISQTLAVLGRREMVCRQETSAFAGTQEHIFKHAVLRDVTYENMLKRVRRVYHALVAEWLIERSGQRADEYAGLIADHLELARQIEQAIPYLRQAGEQAAAQFANAEAVEYFSRALALLDRTKWEPVQVMEQRYALLLGREGVYGLLGERESQSTDLADLTTLAKEIGDNNYRAEVSLRHTAYYRATSDYPAALAAAQEAVQWAKRASNVRKRIEGLIAWGIALWRQGSFQDARGRLEDVLVLAREHGYAQGEATSLHNLGTVSYFLGDFFDAREHLERALEIRQELGERRREAMSLSNLVAVYHGLGDLSGAKTCSERAVAIQRTIGNRQGEAYALTNLAQIHYTLGNNPVAIDYQGQALALYLVSGDQGGQALALRNMGLALHDMGDDTSAQQHCELSLAIEQEIGNRKGEGYSLSYLALALEGLGEWEQAGEAYEDALRLRRELGQDALAMDNLAGLARLALKQDKVVQALANATEILDWIAIHGVQGIDYPLRVYLAIAGVLAATDQDERLAQILADAHAWLQERAAHISDESTRHDFLENVRLHIQLRELISQLG